MMTFEVVIGLPPEIYPGISVDGRGLPENDRELSWSPDGRYLATIDSYNLLIWNVLNWKRIAALSCPAGNSPRTIEFSPRGAYVAVAATNDYLNVFRTSDFATILCIDKHDSWNHSISWSDDESKFAVISGKNTVQIINASNGSTIRTLTVPLETSHGTEELYCLNWQGARLAAGGETGIAYIWDTNSWSQITSHDLNFGDIQSVKWSPDSSYVAFVGQGMTAGGKNNMAFFDSTGTFSHKLKIGTARINSVDWSPDGSALVINNDDYEVKIIDMSGNVLMSLQNGGRDSVAWSSTNLIAVAGGTVQIYAPYDTAYPIGYKLRSAGICQVEQLEQ